MQYQLIFDASQKSFNWRFPLSGLIIAGGLAIVLLLVFTLSKGMPVIKAQKRAWGGVLVALLLSLGWSYVAYDISYSQYQVCQNALNSGNFAVVEGEIASFKPSSDIKGLPPEQFTVEGVTFRYKDSMVSCGYTQTTGGDGPFQEGVHVRVAYLPQVDNTILRLEIGSLP